MSDARRSEGMTERITAYLAGGGLFNPELANHDAVRDLLIDCRDALAASQKEVERLKDVLDCGTNALLDSILASGNDDRTNLHWVRKMRRDSGFDAASPPPETTQGENNA